MKSYGGGGRKHIKLNLVDDCFQPSYIQDRYLNSFLNVKSS